VNAALVPAAVTAGAGGAMVAGIAWREHAARERMRASRVRLSLRFPAGMEPAVVTAALEALSGLSSNNELIFEVMASEGAITHAIWVPSTVRRSAVALLEGVFGSVRIVERDAPGTSNSATLRMSLGVEKHAILSGENAGPASRALLAGFADLQTGESVILRWALIPRPAPRAPAASDDARAQEVQRAWRRKAALRGFAVSGVLLVCAQPSRARGLAGHVASVLRARRTISSGVHIRRRHRRGYMGSVPRTGAAAGWLSVSELVPVLGLPLGADAIENVEYGSRERKARRDLARDGRGLFRARDGRGERKVALGASAALQHVLICGATGSGKSAVMVRGILDEISAGRGGIAIDPQGDLLERVVDRVPPEHAERIVVLDVGDRSRPVPGLAILSGGDPDARADVLTDALRRIFQGAWGVRSETYGRLGIRTLAEVPGASLADMGRLFSDDAYRRRAVGRLRDPFLISAWQEYELLSPGAKAEHVQAPMARFMTLLSRPQVRAVLASSEPKLDVAKLLDERKWLLVSLAPGALSEAGATLVGAAVMHVVWSSIEARASVPPEQRHPVFIFADELATLTNGLPFGFEVLAERARGLGAGLTVALQTLERVPEPTQSSLVGNAATFMTFRAAAREAALVARQLPGLTAADVMALGPFEVAARVGTGIGGGVAVVTGRTEPLPAATGQAQRIRDLSAARYGNDRPAPVEPPEQDQDDDWVVGYRRRQS
jgi:hypothetical protein